jgi:hypothetical protein
MYNAVQTRGVNCIGVAPQIGPLEHINLYGPLSEQNLLSLEVFSVCKWKFWNPLLGLQEIHYLLETERH